MSSKPSALGELGPGDLPATTRAGAFPGGHWNTGYVPKRMGAKPMLSDRDAEPPAAEHDGERRHG